MQLYANELMTFTMCFCNNFIGVSYPLYTTIILLLLLNNYIEWDKFIVYASVIIFTYLY